jgi:glycosyltransferase involved in cell wall biosynthesis
LRLLFLSPFVPSSERPDAYHHLRLLSRQHQVTLVVLYTHEHELAPLKEWRDRLRQIVPLRLPVPGSLLSCAAHALTRWPLYLAYYYTPPLLRAIRRIAADGRFDVVHAHTLRMAPYADAIDVPWKVCNTQDVLTTRYHSYVRHPRRSPGWAIDCEEAWKFRRFEPALWRRMDHVGVVSEEEGEDALRLAPGLSIHVIRPGIDPDVFRPMADLARPSVVVFLGRFSYRPNVDAALTAARVVFPLIRAQEPSAKLVLVGSDPPKALRALAGDGIEVTGRVDDVRPYLERASVSLCPMTTGGGVQNKILQALAMETPVVTSVAGARGLGLSPGSELVVSETHEAMAAVCVELLRDTARGRELGAAGRQAVLRRHAWDVVAESLERFHQR